MSTSTMDIQKKIKKLKSIRNKFDSANQRARDNILGELYPVISDWEDQYPNLRKIFQKKEIDWLLTKEVDGGVKRSGTSFMDFVIKTGYKDEPDLNKHGKPLLLRSTALHRVAKSEEHDECVPDLFKIYCRFDANYTDKESNITHFHVACKYGCVDIVKKFLESGQDPNFSGQKFLELPLHLALMFDREEVVELLLKNGADPNVANMQGLTALHTICKRIHDDDVLEKFFKMCDQKKLTVPLDVWDEQGDTPLNWALTRGLEKVAESLLRRGADPTVANAEGLTPLHIICKRSEDDGMAAMFFKINKERKQKVQIGAKDKSGRTPLQWAVASILPNVVGVLLHNGARVASFVFPTEDYFGEKVKPLGTNENQSDFELRLVLDVLTVVERLVSKGYKLDEPAVITLVRLFIKHGLFKKAENIVNRWNKNEEFVSKAKKIKLNFLDVSFDILVGFTSILTMGL